MCHVANIAAQNSAFRSGKIQLNFDPGSTNTISANSPLIIVGTAIADGMHMTNLYSVCHGEHFRSNLCLQVSCLLKVHLVERNNMRPSTILWIVHA